MAQPLMAETGPETESGAGNRIAERIRSLILAGELSADQRLPGEQELAQRFGVSRPTVREALKRLAAQNLIRTRRGAAGGSFVKRIGTAEAQDQVVSVATLMLSMNDVGADRVTEARLTLLSALAPLTARRATPQDIRAMRAEADRMADPATTDEAFCAADVALLRRFADAADNPMLSLVLAGVIEAVQPLLNMITFRTRDREQIVRRYRRMITMIEAQDAPGAIMELTALGTETGRLIGEAQARRAAKGNGP